MVVVLGVMQNYNLVTVRYTKVKKKKMQQNFMVYLPPHAHRGTGILVD